MVVPVIALLFLISSFFAKVPGGIKWALFVFLATVVQVALGLFAHSIAGLGWLHGLECPHPVRPRGERRHAGEPGGRGRVAAFAVSV